MKLNAKGFKIVGEPVFIKGNVPSLKNSKIKTSRGVFPSKTVKKYLAALGIQKYSVSKKEVKGYSRRGNIFALMFQDAGWEKPEELVYVGFHFVRNSKRKFDYINAMQLPLDLMTAHDFIEDDDCDHIVPIVWEIDGKHYSIDKSNPGVYIAILEKIV